MKPQWHFNARRPCDRMRDSANDAFFSFFRAEGQSPKTGESLGRWGIGKQVFPTASRLHAMFGLTVRHENPERVLMGSAVARAHRKGKCACETLPGKR